MMKLLPILLIGLFAVLSVHFSAWRMERSLRAQSRPLKHDQVDRMLDRLAAAAGIDRIELRLLRNDTVNGLATPQGGIYLTSGLFRHYQSGRLSLEEIGSVVAHELGHLALGHTKRRMLDVSVAQAGVVILGGLLARLIPIVGWYLANLLTGLFVARLSQRDEFEADAYATALMLKAGYGAAPQAAMLEKLEGLLPAGMTAQQSSWLASHPPVAERAAAIRENAARWSGEAAQER